jgi:AraC-like DNA-binding protein
VEEAFKDFIDKIPSDIHAKVENHSSEDMIVFRPSCFLVGVDVYLTDYHICLPTSDPPPLKVENRVHHFNKGKLIAFTPDTRVMCTTHAPTSRYIAMNIKRDFFQEVAKEATGKSDVSFPAVRNAYTSKLVGLICSFEDEVKNYKEACQLMLQSISTQILVQILRESGCINDKKVAVSQNYINLAIEYMFAYYNANIKIEDICKHIHISPYYFIRMFKDRTGQSPHEFLLSIRISKAEDMLRRGDYSIEEVARLCGFVSAAHFSNHFKKINGISPSQHKKNLFYR